jgi:hypothetical protein
MKRFTKLLGVAGLLTGLAIGGCSSAQTDDTASLVTTDIMRRYNSHENGNFPNGPFLNGKWLNGRILNGKWLNGRILNGIGVAVASWEQSPTIVGVVVDDGQPISGAAFVGAELTAEMSDGSTSTVEVQARDTTTVPGLELYLVKYKGGANNGESVCGASNGDPIWATVLPQRFDPTSGSELPDDPNRLSFGCRFGGIQKCQEYGYPKNTKKIERKDGSNRLRRMNDYHASCIRMVRADYCGDGVAHTYDGTSIDIYDHLWNNNAIATSTDGSDGWHIEAEWDSDGAHCISKTRWMPNTVSGLAGNRSSANPDWEYIRVNCPERFAYAVPKVGGGMSVPDRACGTSSKFNTPVGWSQYAEDSVNQAGRAKILNNSQLYMYAP